MTNKISFYKTVRDTSPKGSIDIDIFLDNVKSGEYQDFVLPLRAEADKEKRKALKKKVPAVTLSGVFEDGRKDSNLIAHSNFICIDIDDIDVEEAKSILCADDYVYACFTSISGNGLAVLFKIDPAKHKDAFYGLSSYLEEHYSLYSDKSCVNVARLRFVSYDPYLYINEKARIFKKYLKKSKPTPKKFKFITVESDFDNLVNEVTSRHISIADSYHDWIQIGFALANKFGESGREYFHALSRQSDKYNADKADRKYNNLLKSEAGHVSISTVYYHMKQAGIKLYTTETKEIIGHISSNKRSRISDTDIIDNLVRVGGYSEALVKEILPQVNEDTVLDEVSLIEQVEIEISNRYQLRRNVITRRIELYDRSEWIPINRTLANSIYCDIAKVYPKVSKQQVDIIIDSNITTDFHPIKAFINDNIDINETGLIDNLADSIQSNYGVTGPDRNLLIKKWYVSIVASVFGTHSPLMLILSGATQGTGKTEFFRRLLPSQLKKKYYSESKLDGKQVDDQLLLSSHLILLNDEFDGATAKDIQKLKALLSSDTFTMRVAYARDHESYKRLAVLCGTSNKSDILNDPTGNRRLIPIHVANIDHDRYNAIDKTALFMEAYHLFISGFNCNLTKDEVNLMSQSNEPFKATNAEAELFWRYYSAPSDNSACKFYQTTEIKARIERLTGQRITTRKLGSVLAAEFGKKRSWRENGKKFFGYQLLERFPDTLSNGHQKEDEASKDFIEIVESKEYSPF